MHPSPRAETSSDPSLRRFIAPPPIRFLRGSRYWSSVGGSLGSVGGAAAACLLASFLACLRCRRSRPALSPLCFAIVVFFLDFEAIPSPSRGVGLQAAWWSL